MLATVAQLGVPMILMHMRGTPETMQSMVQYENVAHDVSASLVERSIEAEKAGIRIGTNNHINTPLETCEGTLELLEQVKHDNYYLHLDPSHLWLKHQEINSEFLDKITPRISYLIVQDYIEGSGESYIPRGGEWCLPFCG